MMKRAALASVAAAGFAALAARAQLPNASQRLSHLVDKTVVQHPNALWHIVHDLCVTDMKTSGLSAPCARVNLAGGWAVLKDIQGKTQYLLIPTARVTGVESPALLQPHSPNYFAAAWAARGLFEQRIGHPVPRGQVSLAINSQYGRTQNQLHIHIDCVRADVAQALADHASDIGAHWSDLALGPHGHIYRARWIAGATLVHDPFRLVARADPAARADMASETLVVVGASRADGAPGFVLLADRAGSQPGDPGAGEELQDHDCSVLNPTSAAGAN